MTAPAPSPKRFLHVVFARGNPPREARVLRLAWHDSLDGDHASPVILRAISLAIRSAGADWQFVCAHDGEGNVRLFPASAAATACSLALASGAAPETLLRDVAPHPAPGDRQPTPP